MLDALILLFLIGLGAYVLGRDDWITAPFKVLFYGFIYFWGAIFFIAFWPLILAYYAICALDKYVKSE